MRSKRALTITLACALGLAACARATAPGGGGGPTYPTSADQIVLQMSTGGGFVPIQVNLAQFPEWTLYGDGTLITPGPQIEIYPQPALPSVQVQQVTPDGIRAILIEAGRAGLTGGDAQYTTMNVTDMPTTTFTTTADGATSRVAVYALNFDDQSGVSMPAAEATARAKIGAFLQKLTDLGSWLPQGSVTATQAWEPTALRVHMLPPTPPSDPALQQKDLVWPLSTPMASFGSTSGSMPDGRCGVARGSDLQAMTEAARGANQLTTWVDGEDRASLIFRPELPGEAGCGGG